MRDPLHEEWATTQRTSNASSTTRATCFLTENKVSEDTTKEATFLRDRVAHQDPMSRTRRRRQTCCRRRSSRARCTTRTDKRCRTTGGRRGHGVRRAGRKLCVRPRCGARPSRRSRPTRVGWHTATTSPRAEHEWNEFNWRLEDDGPCQAQPDRQRVVAEQHPTHGPAH